MSVECVDEHDDQFAGADISTGVAFLGLKIKVRQIVAKSSSLDY